MALFCNLCKLPLFKDGDDPTCQCKSWEQKFIELQSELDKARKANEKSLKRIKYLRLIVSTRLPQNKDTQLIYEVLGEVEQSLKLINPPRRERRQR